jgi:hypothetical protein
MDSIKTAIVVTVLLVVGYAVYQAINNNPGPSPPPEVADGFPTSVDVKMPGEKGAADKKGAAPPWAKSNGGTAAGSPRGTDRSGDSLRNSRPGGARDSAGDEPRDRGGQSDALADRRAAPAADPARRPAGSGTAGREAPGASDEEIRRASYEVRQRFREMIAEARRRLNEGAMAEVHLQLSRVYDDPGLSAEESRELAELLDQLAGMVIYSRQHILEPPHAVRSGETLPQIAQRYNVPWQLLAKINGVRDPERLEPGRQLKVLRGPFDAVVSQGRYELVVMLGGYYAGRFPIGIGRDAPRLEGKYVVKEKTVQSPSSGATAAAAGADRSIPAGNYWIGLTERIGIHGTSDLRSLRRADGRGSILLGERDVEDVFDILSADSELSVGSRVTIKR